MLVALTFILLGLNAFLTLILPPQLMILIEIMLIVLGVMMIKYNPYEE